MRKLIIILALLTLILPTQYLTVQASGISENNSGSVLCPPSVYLEDVQDCAPLGPSVYLTNLAHQGIELPIKPLQVSHPDPTLNELPYNYYRVNNSGTAFYPSIDAARAKNGASMILPPGAFFYVVYTQRLDTEKGTYFLLPSGAYMPGDGSTVSISNPFPGVEIKAPPQNQFGFVFRQTGIRREPNEMNFNEPIGLLEPNSRDYPIVQIFDTVNIEGTEWHLIGPDEWVLGRDVAVITPNPTPPDGVTTGRWIDVDLAEQTLAVYENNTMVYATIVATGEKPLYTRPGLFQIYDKKELETMQGERNTENFYYLENVPWTMYFDKARALHGAYWRAKMGYTQSHGCVNLSPGDSHWLYNWAKVNDWVYIHDPSGLTPTDPSYYGDGGA